MRSRSETFAHMAQPLKIEIFLSKSAATTVDFLEFDSFIAGLQNKQQVLPHRLYINYRKVLPLQFDTFLDSSEFKAINNCENSKL